MEPAPPPSIDPYQYGIDAAHLAKQLTSWKRHVPFLSTPSFQKVREFVNKHTHLTHHYNPEVGRACTHLANAIENSFSFPAANRLAVRLRSIRFGLPKELWDKIWEGNSIHLFKLNRYYRDQEASLYLFYLEKRLPAGYFPLFVKNINGYVKPYQQLWQYLQLLRQYYANRESPLSKRLNRFRLEIFKQYQTLGCKEALAALGCRVADENFRLFYKCLVIDHSYLIAGHHPITPLFDNEGAKHSVLIKRARVWVRARLLESNIENFTLYNVQMIPPELYPVGGIRVLKIDSSDLIDLTNLQHLPGLQKIVLSCINPFLIYPVLKPPLEIEHITLKATNLI